MSLTEELKDRNAQDLATMRESYFGVVDRECSGRTEPADVALVAELLPALKKSEADFARDLANYRLFLQAVENEKSCKVMPPAQFEALLAARDQAFAALEVAKNAAAVAKNAFDAAWSLPGRAQQMAAETRDTKLRCGDLFLDFVPPPAAPTIVRRMMDAPVQRIS